METGTGVQLRHWSRTVVRTAELQQRAQLEVAVLQHLMHSSLSLDVEAMGCIRWVFRPLKKAPAELDTDGDSGEGRKEEEKLHSVRALSISGRNVVPVQYHLLPTPPCFLLLRALLHTGDLQCV